ncbi:MAG: hypothetical protein AB7T59_13855 [Hyphomonadaceae bacterium]
MNVFQGLATAVAAGALFTLGGCTTSADTHHHGPRQTMSDADMAADTRECPYDTASHDMNRPHDNGRMLTAAHPNCRDQEAATATEETPAEPEPQQPQ